MPECGLFLRNLCINPHCRYLHVKKAGNAVDCEEFLGSWCSLGVTCPKRHYVPPADTDKKRRRDADADDTEPDVDEETVLRRVWEESAVLNMYD